MGSNVMLFGWNRSVPGTALRGVREVPWRLAAEGCDSDFRCRVPRPHGGDLNGFFLIKGDSAKLDALVSTTEWITHITRAALHLDGSGVVRGVTGDEIMGRMALWTSVIPS